MSQSDTLMMRAARHIKYSEQDGLVFGETPKPHPQNNEVLIEVKSASLNSWDLDILRGSPFITRLDGGFFGPKRPILGADVAGIVASVGANVSDFKVGDRVFGDLSAGNWGAFAQFVCADAAKLSQIPPTMSFEIAAAIPQAGVLALQALRDVRAVQPGDRVLINGAGGGTGCFAIQLAKRKGAHIVAVDKKTKSAEMLDWGADEVLDYHETDFMNCGQKFALIIDVVGQHKASEYKSILTEDGALALVGGKTSTLLSIAPHAMRKRKSGRPKLGIVVHKVNRADQDELARMVVAGELAVHIDSVLPMAEVRSAFSRFSSGNVVGKLILSTARYPVKVLKFLLNF